MWRGRRDALFARRVEQSAAGRATTAPGDTTTRPAGPSADQLYQNARRQHTRGALTTARSGYQHFLQSYSTDPRAPDALYYIGETFGEAAPDSATAYYTQVIGQFPQSARASTALLRLGNGTWGAAIRRDIQERIGRELPVSVVYVTLHATPGCRQVEQPPDAGHVDFTPHVRARPSADSRMRKTAST